jgi:hypothetical protein
MDVLRLVPLASLALLACGSDPVAPRDSGPRVEDAAAESDASSIADADPDAASADDAGPGCVESIVLPHAGPPPCSAATRSCVDACTASGCPVDCIEADPAPQCSDCADRALVSCINRNGCQDAWDCYVECIGRCGGADACISAMCADVEDAWNACSDALGPESVCLTRYVDCLPAS